jgi:NADPH-dependent ferric siderophore reductase
VSTRAEQYVARVRSREQLSPHLVRLVLGGPGLVGFASTGVPDEWVGLVVPGQFQSRYYTVRSWDGADVTLDVVIHERGLVTEWIAGDCVGDEVTVSEAKGSFAMPPSARWLLLVGDLTGLPAMARIGETVAGVPVRAWAEVADDLPGYLPDRVDVTWLAPPSEGASALAAVVRSLDWPAGEGYFWMAGESAQMRAIRRHLMRERRLPVSAYDVMGYWRGGDARRPRAVDPTPLWVAGKAAGKGDDEIWADYDAAGEHDG